MFTSNNWTVSVLFFVLCAFSITSVASAATVRSVNSKRSRVIVTLDGTTTKKGDSLCFYADKKEIECGEVSAVSKKSGTATVKVTKKNLRKIKKGMVVLNPNAGTRIAAGSSHATRGTKVWFSWTPGIMTPAVFNSLEYSGADVPNSLWISDTTISSSFAGFGAQVGFSVGSISVIPGFRYRIFNSDQVLSDYTPGVNDPFVATTISATAIGIFADLAFLQIPIGSSMGIFATGGIDIDMSTVNVKADKRDDTGRTEESTIASGTSSMNVISLRAGGGFDLVPFKPFGASIGLNVLIPLTEMGKKFSGSIEDNESKGVADPGTDLKTSLGHKKSGFGLDVQMSALLVF